MVTEPADPQIDYWADDLDEELVEAGMDAPQAKAFARAFQLGMTRALQHCATRADLALLATKEELWMVRDDMRREMDQLRADIDRRFRVLYWILGIGFGVGFGGMFALMAAILARL